MSTPRGPELDAELRTPDPKALRALCEDAKKREPLRHTPFIQAVSPDVVLALLDRLDQAEQDRDRLRDDAQRLVDGWRAEADRARATGLTIEAVRGLVEAWDRTEITFSRMVEDLRVLAMVRAETAERELAEARVKLDAYDSVEGRSRAVIIARAEQAARERDEARAEVDKLHGITLDVMRERDEARAALIRSQEDHRAAVEALETYEERIGDIADHVLGLVPPDVPSIVKLDAIERRCGEERVAARQAERERDAARAARELHADMLPYDYAAWEKLGSAPAGAPEVVRSIRTVEDALAVVNVHLDIDAGMTTKGDEVKCWTWDGEGGRGKTYLSAGHCADLSAAFGILRAALKEVGLWAARNGMPEATPNVDGLVACWVCKRLVPFDSAVCMPGVGTQCIDRVACVRGRKRGTP